MVPKLTPNHHIPIPENLEANSSVRKRAPMSFNRLIMSAENSSKRDSSTPNQKLDFSFLHIKINLDVFGVIFRVRVYCFGALSTSEITSRSIITEKGRHLYRQYLENLAKRI